MAGRPRRRFDGRLGQPLFLAGLRRVGPTTASIVGTDEPVATVLLAFAVLGETLAADQLARGALVLTVAVLVAHAGARSPAATPRLADPAMRG
ncbi:MAG TPA: DMT family transporter [Solirubrobacteraceae bacterium]|nr:DMT family transporter [Solirubrobacteraceae bacterium]